MLTSFSLSQFPLTSAASSSAIWTSSAIEVNSSTDKTELNGLEKVEFYLVGFAKDSILVTKSMIETKLEKQDFSEYTQVAVSTDSGYLVFGTNNEEQ